ncbi:adenylosuccinate synthase [soil metagenome]
MKKASVFSLGITLVTDTGWGDAGKGKITDEIAAILPKGSVVIRYNGGPNAGHTVRNKLGEFKLHGVSSGIFNPDVVCLTTGGVLVNPLSLVEEIALVQKAGVKITPENFLLSEDSHMIMPWHKLRDNLSEKARGGSKIGTTGQGIGPTYSDRTARVGLRLGDLIRPNFKELLKRELAFQERLIRLMDGESLASEGKTIVQKTPYLDEAQILTDFDKAKKVLAPFITNTLVVIWEAKKKKKTMLAEGAQGALLDLALGGYPYVTSSHPGVPGFSATSGIHLIDRVIGVAKAYTTRVGEGPMPTELFDETGKHMQNVGHEFGATTGRPRRCGWFDVPAMQYGAKIAGVTEIALTKLDILDGLKEVKICTGYTMHGKEVTELTGFAPEDVEKAKPIYETLTGWKEPISDITEFETLPKNAQKYVKRLEKLLGFPITIVSVSPDRDKTIYR